MVATNPRQRIFGDCVKYDKTCVLSLLKHSCWSAIILGLIMLALGIVLRSTIIGNQTATVQSSGLLFILIGIFIVCMGPFAAIYDLVARRKRTADEQENHISRASSARPSQASQPPSYNQVMTAAKTPSATTFMRFSELSAKELSQDSAQPPPPSYEEVYGKDSRYLNNCRVVSPESSNSSQDIRRMTSP